MYMKKGAIFIFPDVEELDFVGVFEVLAKSKGMHEEGVIQLDEPMQVDILAREKEVKCRNGLIVKPNKIASNFDGYNILIVPGGKGVHELMKDKEILTNIQAFAKERNHLACSVCTGSLILGKAGILANKKAATHHMHRNELKKYCQIAEERVVVDGNVITSGGIVCSIDLGFKLLELLYGRKNAEKVAKRLEIRTTSIS
jgi:cyclohexyl-isocyanide hydratase